LNEYNFDLISCTDVGTELESVPINEKVLLVNFEKKMTSRGLQDTCPPPIVFYESIFGNAEMSYQPMCDFSLAIRPLILAACSLSALYIVSSSVRR
jgi:hypothetical protein